jgi:predicted metal-dependent hydrolase
VVYELCYLERQNHSVNFWALVKKILPEHKNRKQESERKRDAIGKFVCGDSCG